MCGVNTILSSSNNLQSFAGGSSSYTSKAAPPILSLDNASYNASSSMIPPRAQFAINAVSFIISNSFVEIKCLVSGVRGTWIVMKSAFLSTVSKSVNSTPI